MWVRRRSTIKKIGKHYPVLDEISYGFLVDDLGEKKKYMPLIAHAGDGPDESAAAYTESS